MSWVTSWQTLRSLLLFYAFFAGAFKCDSKFFFHIEKEINSSSQDMDNNLKQWQNSCPVHQIE